MLFFCVALFFYCSLSAPKWHELEGYTFEQYEHDFRKVYTQDEREDRRALFLANLNSIKRHNKDGAFTWKQGVNRFTDRTMQERKALNGGIPSHNVKLHPNQPTHIDLAAFEEVGAVDWRAKDVITSVKDQGDCGSCWSFGSAETVESYYALATGILSDLSEQQILDCTPNPNDCGGTGGCGGGTAQLAFARIMAMKGIATEWTYPYISYSGKNYQCHVDSNTPAFTLVDEFYTLPKNKYAPVIAHLATEGPLAIDVDASAWSSYEEGVFDGCNMTNPDIDHVVQLVGYGVDDKLGPYWLVRNSWSAAWGESGYIRLRRHNDEHNCGIDLKPGDGTGCNGGPSSVTVCGICGILYDTSYVKASKPPK